jgi:hypothetical protein
MAWYIAELKKRLLSKIEVDGAGCWNWTGAKRHGYGAIRVDGKTLGAHAVAFMVYRGPIKKREHVCHRCDNPACINPDHLFTGSPADNVADKVAKGRQSRQKGVDAARVKLTEADVRDIRDATGIPLREIGRRFGVSHVQVLRIRSGQSWSHLNGGAQ